MDERIATTARTRRAGRVVRPDFDAFYRSSWEEIYRPLAVTLQDTDLAREAVDEGMVRAYRKWRHVRGYGNQEGWVYRVALNWAISQKRKTGRQIPVPTVHEDGAYQDIPIDLYRALRKLRIDYRAVLVLRYLLDWPEAEIARALSIRPGTVKSRLHRALALMRKEMS